MSCLQIVTIGYLLLLPLTNINGEELYDKNFIAGIDKFAVQLYSTIADKYPDKVVLFSPLSVQMCATMALMGARGEAATELRQGLGFGSLDNDVLADMYNRFLTKHENSTILKISNKIYVTAGRKGLKTFVNTVKNKFYSEASNLDFMAGEEAVISMNDWIESKSNHLIKDFIPFGAFQRTGRIILLNVIHFKADWDAVPHYPCDRKDVYYECERFWFDLNYLYGTPYDSTKLLPYRDPNFLNLYATTQRKGTTRQFDNYMKTTTINNMIKQLNGKLFGYTIPKCNIAMDMGLVDAFQKLGMNRIFNKKEADFGDMLNVTEPLKISGIIHRTMLNFNLERTEAVAATAIQFHARCSGKFNDTKNPFCPVEVMTTFLYKTEDGDFIPMFMERDLY